MYISNCFKDFYKFFNRPIVKDSVKNGIGVTTFAIGVFELCKFSSDCWHRRIEFRGPLTAQKLVNMMARLSLVTSAIVSRPGLTMSRWVVTRIFTDEQLLRYFGPNLNFATTPLHPRHVLSLLSFAMGVPATVQTIRKCVWLRSGEKRHITIEDCMVVWNTLTSRPMLHLVNALFRTVF